MFENNTQAFLNFYLICCKDIVQYEQANQHQILSRTNVKKSQNEAFKEELPFKYLEQVSKIIYENICITEQENSQRI